MNALSEYGQELDSWSADALLPVVHERRIYDFTGMLVQIGVLKARPA